MQKKSRLETPAQERRRQGGIALRAALILLVSVPAPALQVTHRTEPVPEGLRIIFAWAEPVHFHSSVEGRELLLQFDRPFEAPQIEYLRQQAPDWIEGVSAGFDTVLLRASRGVEFTVSGGGNEVIVTLTPAPETGSPPSVEDTATQVRLELLQAQLLAESGREGKALEALRALAEKYPAHTQVLASLAQIENRVGRWRRAENLYRHALQSEARNEDIQEARASLWRERAPQVQIDVNRKMVQSRHSEQLTRLSGHAILDPFLRVGLVYEQDFFDVNNLLRPNGKIGSLAGVRQRGEVYIQQDFENGSELRGSLLAGDSTVGLGFQYAVPDTRGQTRVRLDYRRPYWEFIEGVVDGGVRDRLEVRRQHRLWPRLVGGAAVALNRYGMDADNDVAKSVGLEGNLSYTLVSSKPLFAVEYWLDREARRSVAIRTDARGVAFSPLPLVSREVHAFQTLAGTGGRSQWREER